MDAEEISSVKQELRSQGYNIYVYSYPAGMCICTHQHGYSKLHVLLNGSMILIVNGTEHLLHPGDRILVPANTPHSAEILGEFSAVCIDATKYEV